MHRLIFGIFTIFIIINPTIVAGKCKDGPLADIDVDKELGGKSWLLVTGNMRYVCNKYNWTALYKNSYMAIETVFDKNGAVSHLLYTARGGQGLYYSTLPNGETEIWRTPPMGISGLSKCKCWYMCDKDGNKATDVACITPSLKDKVACEKPFESIKKAMEFESEVKDLYDEKCDA